MNEPKIAFLFSGQGSQYRGMGKMLFEENDIFKSSIQKSDALFQKLISRSLIKELYEKKVPEFSELLITHPAIVSIEIAMYEVLRNMGIKPTYVAGNSLGEFAAGVASEIWSVEAAITAAVEQAKSLMRRVQEGGMLAVIDPLKKIEAGDYKDEGLYLAADNFEGHFTLSGSLKSISTFQKKLDKLNVQYLLLPVKVPFHSPLVNEGLIDFDYYMADTVFDYPSVSFYSGVYGKELKEFPSNYFSKAVGEYSCFSDLVTFFEKERTDIYVDLGPSGTCATFVKYNLAPTSKAKIFPIVSPFNNEQNQLRKLKGFLSK